ncbi:MULTISPECIES: glutathione peroxidase [unclassified Fusibacter]|uniref:glutathione peroxidase n=1 Tax=unclassified Fusibacter TaxID=2624464 RepID=UPI00101091BB|nr:MULTISPECIES: glutathione peroxidase [unclassified Fusibacter]MCK8059672.1 glutathione peroxidase [Fusibacter sp. A2]NPE21473.1 glutathione peroxidase [Fusibacter sp. A1]RXV61884.1 glutathione peroxidase [Fusibacter sp. A1]
MSFYQLEAVDGFNKVKSMQAYKGKVVLVVNTASKCGFTPQFEGLEELYKTYKDQGLEILGFPCNQFKEQEPGSQDEIVQFCQLNYGVTFEIFEKVDVKGENIHPIFDYLTNQKKGALGSKDVKWNFTKFLIDQNGKVVKRFAPTDTPKKIEKSIKELL